MCLAGQRLRSRNRCVLEDTRSRSWGGKCRELTSNLEGASEKYMYQHLLKARVHAVWVQMLQMSLICCKFQETSCLRQGMN